MCDRMGLIAGVCGGVVLSVALAEAGWALGGALLTAVGLYAAVLVGAGLGPFAVCGGDHGGGRALRGGGCPGGRGGVSDRAGVGAAERGVDDVSGAPLGMRDRFGLSAGGCGGLMLAVALARGGAVALLAAAALVAAWLVCMPAAAAPGEGGGEGWASSAAWVLAAPVGTLVGAVVGWRLAAVMALSVCLAAAWAAGARAGRAVLGGGG
jgi:hypothetical protein